jgi:cytochrome P450
VAYYPPTRRADIAIVHLFDPDFRVDPYPHYACWCETQPVFWDEKLCAWVLTRHDDIRAILKNSADFSSSAMGQGNRLPLLTDDPPRHTQLRALVDRAFTARMLRSLEPRLESIARSLVAAFAPGVATDVVRGLTTPLPVAVISDMMGIPVERSDDFKRWSDALTGTLAGASHESRQKDMQEMALYFQSLIPERRERPRDDLVSAVVNAEIDGERLSDEDIVGFNILLLIAGNETTTNLLGNLLNILADRPALYARLVAEPGLVDAAIEETLRFDPPVQFLIRQATVDTALHGSRIARGDHVFVVMAAANRDPRAYDDPHTFSLDRPRNHHHTFGFGIHFCMGAPLARLEARAAMRALLARFPRMTRASGGDERTASPLLRGFHHLWLEFQPTA